MDVNEHERLFNVTLRHKLVRKGRMLMNMKDYLTLRLIFRYKLVRKGMDVNEHERLFNVTLRHKLK